MVDKISLSLLLINHMKRLIIKSRQVFVSSKYCIYVLKLYIYNSAFTDQVLQVQGFFKKSSTRSVTRVTR